MFIENPVRVLHVEDHLGLAYKVALPYARPGEKVEDTEEYAECMVALFKACQNYKSSKGSFSHYAIHLMRNRLIDFYKLHKREIPVESLDGDVEEVEEKDFDLDWLLAECPEDTERDKRDKWVLKRHYLEGESWKDLGKSLGVSNEMARQYGLRAISTIRERILNDHQ